MSKDGRENHGQDDSTTTTDRIQRVGEVGALNRESRTNDANFYSDDDDAGEYFASRGGESDLVGREGKSASVSASTATETEERTSGGIESQGSSSCWNEPPGVCGAFLRGGGGLNHNSSARTSKEDVEVAVRHHDRSSGVRRDDYYGATADNWDDSPHSTADDRAAPQAHPRGYSSDERRPLIKTHLSMSAESSSHGSDVMEESAVRGCNEKEDRENKAANDADTYLAMGLVARAFPERFSALIITLLVEIPTLFIISGGSDQLCQLIGRQRYQLLIAFLPLTSAISGNVGLQASTLTTRAVSHLHVTKGHFWKWLRMEVGAAFFLGLSMGAALGLFAYHTGGNDPALGVTIFIAQFVSILTAGLTGTLAPLIFTFVFHRDSGQWGGPLETAIQDIIGSFAMIVLSYHTLMAFGTPEIDPDDRCGG